MSAEYCDMCGRVTDHPLPACPGLEPSREWGHATMQDLAVCSFRNAATMVERGHLKQAYIEAQSGQRQLKAAISSNEKLTDPAANNP